jgi:hypothetical protein
VLVLNLGEGKLFGWHGFPALLVSVVELNFFSYLLVYLFHFQFILDLLQVFLHLLSTQFDWIRLIGVLQIPAIRDNIGHHEGLELSTCEFAVPREYRRALA